MTISIITAILTLMAGIGVFLMACHLMSSHLESAGSKRLKQLFSSVSGSKWTGVGIGALGTAAIQSSGAVTVMVIGFVNVGIMSLAQASTVIYGANIGTTVTAQLVALGLSSGNGISTTIIFSALAGVGAFILMFAKRESWKHTGGILTGFGILFVGLGMMSNAMDDFQRSINIVTTMNFSETKQFVKTEKELNYLNGELLRYAVLLSGNQLNNSDLKYLNSSIRSVSDLERIGDYAENIVEYAESLKSQDASFSEKAIDEIRKMEKKILDLYEVICDAYHNLNLKALEWAYIIEDEIDDLTDEMERNHIQRLVNGECTPQVGAEYLSLAKNAERIADHLINVGNTIKQ